MEWVIGCSEKTFRSGEVLSTEITIVPPGGRILLATAVLTGRFFVGREGAVFMETAPGVLGVNVEAVESARYSALLPERLPSSYMGKSVSVVYTLHVTVQTKEEAVSRSLLVQIYEKELLAGRQKIDKVKLSARSISINGCDGDTGDSVGLGSCGADSSSARNSSYAGYNRNESANRKDEVENRENYMHSEIVKELREGRGSSVEWVGRKEDEIEEALRRVYSLNVEKRARKYLEIEREKGISPLRVYSELRRKEEGEEAIIKRKSTYSIKKEGVESASVAVEIREEAMPGWSLAVVVKFAERAEKLRLSLQQVEKVGEKEERMVFYEEEKAVKNCMSCSFYIPVDGSRNAVVRTPYFTTAICLKVEIDSLSAYISID